MGSSVGNKKDVHLSSSSFYLEDHGAASSSPSSDHGSYATYEEDSTALLMDHNTAAAPPPLPDVNNHTAFHATTVDLGFRPHNHHLSLINFKSNETTTDNDCFRHATAGAGHGGSLLSFQQEPPPLKNNMDSSSAFMWKDDDHDHGNINDTTNSFGNNCGYNLRQAMISTNNNDLKSGAASESHLIDEISNYQPASSSYGWLYSESTVVTADRVQETRHQGSSSSPLLLKRPYMGDHHSMASSKKQCTAGSGSSSAKNSKSKSTSSNKDPQSLAAKNRRERISERLKVLQELVPNGPKVDLVTMLEKAISYVKFLQLQVKVLATDEFWPAQGGKAPDVSQVKEAIDAILASQRERSSSSK